MNKKRIVRIQLGLLILLALLMVIRLLVGPPKPDGFLVFVDMDDHELKHDAFTLEKPAEVMLEVNGSFVDEQNPELAVYGWIVNRADRQVVWQMDNTNTIRDGRTLAHAEDIVRLDAGTYDVYFTSYGNESGNHNHKWERDDNKWRIVLNIVGGETGMARSLSGQLSKAAPAGENLLWTSAPADDDVVDEYLFRVNRPTAVRVYGIGEMEPRNMMDYGWIEDATTGQHVWEMSMSNTEAAGGSVTNRRFDGDVVLPPGLYRAVYQTDAGHDADRWHTNPPYDPAAWGLSLYANDASAFSTFDPWTSSQPLISMTKVGDDASLSQSFEVVRPARVIVYGMGEMTGKGRGDRFDYAKLKKQSTSDEEEFVWQMSYENSKPAGGTSKNRVEIAFLQLAPGSYTLTYVTDDSHSFEGWNNSRSRPTHPERWGVTLFPMMPADASAIQVGSSASGVPMPPLPPINAAPNAPGAPSSLSSIALAQAARRWNEKGVLDWTQLSNDFDGRFVFKLEEPTSIAINALGEHTVRGWHDYGWIEQVPGGEKVWEMTLDNTSAAGGDDRNRRYEGQVDLPAGAYALHYKTDFSHNYGDFGAHAPDNESGWGIQMSKMWK